MAVFTWKVSTDARCIYLYGTRKLADEAADYVEPVKQYAVENFTSDQIDNALAQGWISQQEYDETMAYGSQQA